jgi:(2Fe-2S) ferredoxin
MAKRKHYLFVCTNQRPEGAPHGSCAARGSVAVHAALKSGLKASGLAEVGARACTSSCLDVCWEGPVVFVEPDGYAYGHVQLDDVPDIISGLAQGQPVERLLLGDIAYTEPKNR